LCLDYMHEKSVPSLPCHTKVTHSLEINAKLRERRIHVDGGTLGEAFESVQCFSAGWNQFQWIWVKLMFGCSFFVISKCKKSKCNDMWYVFKPSRYPGETMSCNKKSNVMFIQNFCLIVSACKFLVRTVSWIET